MADFMNFATETKHQVNWALGNISCAHSQRKIMCQGLQNLLESSQRVEQISLLDFRSSGWIWAGALFYTPLCILGILGNLLTVILFCKYMQKTTTSILIIALAIVDLVICMTAMPIAIYTFVDGTLRSNFLCKLEKFLVYFGIPLSCGILFLIALDRFLLIMCLNRGLITPFRAKASILFLLVICLASAIPQTLGFSTRVAMEVPNCHEFICDFHKCLPTEYYLSNRTANDLKKSVIWAFLGIAILVTIFYSLIFVKVYKIHKKTADVKSPASSHVLSLASTSSGNLGQPKTVEKNVTKIWTMQESSDSERVLTEEIALKNRNEPLPALTTSKRKTKRLPHLQTAITLFLVTFSFIVAYAPMSIMILFNICEKTKDYEGCLRNDYRHFLWQFYYLNHVMNPIIYSLLNPQFKKAFRKFYNKHCCKIFHICCPVS